ncbi:endolytic transglycosylase MltG [Microbacterium gorillae]|uniref:endolytic transglycosylase MltG n=1 Tax=Microbacterium gorillae TaxID=1231063 RepID=UPI003D96F43B
MTDPAGHEPESAPMSRREARAAAAQSQNGSEAQPPTGVPASGQAQRPDHGAPAAVGPDAGISDAGNAVPPADPPATVALPLQDAAAASATAAAAAAQPTRRAAAETSEAPDGLTDMADLFAAEPVPAADVKQKRRKRRRGCLVGLIVMLVVLGGIAAAVVTVYNVFGDQIRDVLGMSEPADFEAGTEGDPVLVTIGPGDSGLDISGTLYTAGVTKTSEAFYDYVRGLSSPADFYPGLYQLNSHMTSKAAYEALIDPANKRENTLLIREGEPTGLIYEELATVLEISVDDVKAAAADPSQFGVSASSLEGWLFPATYTLEPGMSAHDAIQTLVNRMVQALDEAGVPVEKRQEILTIASIVQREGRTDDFAKVARVIYNRLDPSNMETHGLLQMDSTVQYGVGKLTLGVVSTSDADRKNDNPYNTYLHPGLPAGPISSPGDAAIAAALHPADGPWFYFVTVNLDTGETLFAETYAEQQANEEKWHQWCEANPDSGCY